MAPTPSRSLAAERALQALLRALPAGALLRLQGGAPATSVAGGVAAPLGRTPLSGAQIEALVADPALADALKAGPGAHAQWQLTVADAVFAASFAWPASGSWGLELSAVAAAPAGPAPSPASSVAQALATPVPAPAAESAPAAPTPSSSAAPAEDLVPPALAAILQAARSAQAADVHLQAKEPVRRRLAGALLPSGEALPPEQVSAFVSALLPAALVPELAARGSVDFAVDSRACGRFRANVSRQASGLKLCLRVVPEAPRTLAALSLPSDVEAVANYHQGLAIFAGPKGHGKTNTMAAVVDVINARSRAHIITVEDPIEVVHVPKRAVVSQRQVGEHTQSFARALKGALREDPDVIVIGELRDRETVEIALTASETGHLVLATMSTRSAAKTVDRLIDLFPPDQQQQVRATLAGALKMVVSQRLVPTVAGPLTPAIEIMTGSVPLWSLIRENKLFQLPSLQQRGRAIGMVRLDASLEALVREQRVAPEVALSFAEERGELERRLREAKPAAVTSGVAGASKGP